VHRELKIYVDDKELQFTDAKPYISEFGRTMIPIRAVTESFGANVDWNGILKKVTITYDDIEIYFLVVHPDNIVVINDLKTNQSKSVPMDSKPVIKTTERLCLCELLVKHLVIKFTGMRANTKLLLIQRINSLYFYKSCFKRYLLSMCC